MPKPDHFLVPPTMEVLDHQPTRVDTFSRYLLAALALLALALTTGSLMGYVSVYGGLL